MDANVVLALGLGVRAPWKLVGQRLDRDKQPNELHLEVAAARGALFHEAGEKVAPHRDACDQHARMPFQPDQGRADRGDQHSRQNATDCLRRSEQRTSIKEDEPPSRE
jgi:hypothetical protein